MNSKVCKTVKKYIYTIVALTAMLASCSQDAELNEIIDNKPKAITEVGVSTSAETRAVVSSSDQTKVNWESDDQLGVFGEGAIGAVAYTLDGVAGSTSGTFKNEASTITTIQAMMYPHQSTATWAESKLTCEIPIVQTATPGSFDKSAAIMYSIGSSTNVTLDYAVNFLKVSVTESNIHSITVSSTDAVLSGTVEISSTGVTAASSGAMNCVTLVASGQYPEDCLATGTYYIAVKKGNITNPSISYTYIDSNSHTAEVKTKAGSNTLEFAEGKNVKTIKAPSSWDSSRDAKQLWEHGPFFATINVGQTVTDYSTITTAVTDENKASIYSTANVGGLYQWGGTINRRDNSGNNDYSNSTTDIAGTADDTATKLWGSAWCMPTRSDLNHLRNKSDDGSSDLSSKAVTWLLCKGSSTQYVAGCTLTGYKVTGVENGYTNNSIFFPAAGYGDNVSVTQLGNEGYYWASSPINSSEVSRLSFDLNTQYEFYRSRSKIYSVRAVIR